MVRDVRMDTIKYKNRSVKVTQPGWFCTGCDEVVLDGVDSAVTESTFTQLKNEVEGKPLETRYEQEK